MYTKKILIAALLLVGAGALYVKYGKHNDVPVKPPTKMTDPVTPPVAPPVTPPPVVPPVAPPEVLANFSNYQEALAAAKKHNRPIFLYFSAEWCGWCKKMKSETLSDAAVKYKLGKEYVTCLIDTDKDRATARKYKVSGIPAYMVIDTSETVVVRDSGFKSKHDMLIWLRPKNVSLLEDKY